MGRGGEKESKQVRKRGKPDRWKLDFRMPRGFPQEQDGSSPDPPRGGVEILACTVGRVKGESIDNKSHHEAAVESDDSLRKHQSSRNGGNETPYDFH